MNKESFNFDDDSLDLSMALAATEVGVEVLQTCMEYFSSMLIKSLQEVSHYTGEDMFQIKLRYERELGLETTLENSLLTMQATREFISNHELRED